MELCSGEEHSFFMLGAWPDVLSTTKSLKKDRQVRQSALMFRHWRCGRVDIELKVCCVPTGASIARTLAASTFLASDERRRGRVDLELKVSCVPTGAFIFSCCSDKHPIVLYSFRAFGN